MGMGYGAKRGRVARGRRGSGASGRRLPARAAVLSSYGTAPEAASLWESRLATHWRDHEPCGLICELRRDNRRAQGRLGNPLKPAHACRSRVIPQGLLGGRRREECLRGFENLLYRKTLDIPSFRL